ncbi:MAG: glycosyltransferase [Blastocatellia bacterium]
MRVVMFYHSLLSDWNHGNAHFLRGVVTELNARGHEVIVYEPRHGWSLTNLVAGHGAEVIAQFRAAYPHLDSTFYDQATFDPDEALDGADLVIVHEWNDHDLARRIGAHRARSSSYRLLFHDTHHRSVTEPEGMAAYDLRHYDGVLAFGEVIREIYLKRGWTQRAWTWHEAADTRVFFPRPQDEAEGDLVWIGNWGDDERAAELREFLIEPAAQLRLKTRIHGVRYPEHALAMLNSAGIAYAGWLPNFAAPQVFARFKFTVHIPRRPYVVSLPGIPTIRVFEALACGLPLVCAPWDDVEGLFNPGRDYLVADCGAEMKRHLKSLVDDPELRRELAANGLKTILEHHTCRHRVDELMTIYAELVKQERPARQVAEAVI